MRIEFHAAAAAYNNTDVAMRREACRMASIAYGLKMLGHQAVVVNKPKMDDKYWKSFAHLDGRSRKPDVIVVPAELVVKHARHIPPFGIVVGFKTSAGCQHDEAILDAFSIVMAHEYDAKYENHPALLPIPFLVHQRVLDTWTEQGCLSNYLDDDLAFFREKYATEKIGLLGYLGCNHLHRREFLATAPEWCQWKLYDSHLMSGEGHAKWLMQFHAGLHLSGITPKTNLHPLLVLLGLLTVTTPMPVHDTPPIDDTNAVVFQDWETTHRIITDDTERAKRIAAADESYRNGWSPIGQAQQLLARLERIG